MAYIQNSAYHLGNSILHSTGARSKILLALACIFVTGAGGGLALVFMFFLCHLGMLVSGIFILDAWKRLAALKILFLVLGVTPLFLTPGAPLYFYSEFSLPITKEGLECSIFTVSRLMHGMDFHDPGTDNVTTVSYGNSLWFEVKVFCKEQSPAGICAGRHIVVSDPASSSC